MSAVLAFDQDPSPRAMIPAGEPTPGDMLRFAMESKADIATLRELMQLQREWNADQARKAFNVALSAFKANPPDIIRDKDNKQYGSKYVSLPNLLNTGGIALGAHGLSATFDVDQSNGIKVTCRLTHTLGHYEEVSMTGPLDNSGQKNPLQQVKSTVTYLRGATFEAVTGLASRDPRADDDGNGSGKKPVDHGPDSKLAERVAAHLAACDQHSESLAFIRKSIEAGDWKAVATEWDAISVPDQETLWLAPKFGGKAFTTAERDAIKANISKGRK